MKRLLDIVVSALGLTLTSPVMIPVCFIIWLQDRHSPFYIANRVGRKGHLFRMVKLRSMVIHADKTGVDSTSNKDPRITRVGSFIRAYKLDEIPQLWNVLKGEMSLVGPRPNVKERGTDLYNDLEKGLLRARPGITDLSSIVFSDEGAILEHSKDPDGDYNLLIRPWKSRLGLLYIDRRSFFLDLRIIFLTTMAIVSKQSALEGVHKILMGLRADPDLIEVCRREKTLVPAPLPGMDAVQM